MTQHNNTAAVTALAFGTTCVLLGTVATLLDIIQYLGALSALCAVLAIVFGAVGNSKSKKKEGTGKAMALIGLLLGMLFLAWGLGWAVSIGAFFAT